MTAERALRWGAAGAIVTVATLRVCATFVPRLVFDVDPSLDAAPLGGFGPAGSLTLDALLLAACAAGLWGESLAGRRIDWRLVALALLPLPVVAWHGASDFGDLWRGATWVAAAAGCATMAHVGRDRQLRPLLVAVLVAVLAPVLLRGLCQSGVTLGPVEIAGPEHAAMVREFERHRDAFLADRGWPPDSPAARIYERRLRSPDPRGWFPTSNIFASLMAFGQVLCLGLAVEGALRRRGRRWLAGFAAASGAGLVALALAGSKGAIGAALVGSAVVAAAAWALGRGRRPSPRAAGAIALGLVACVLLGVVVRGVVLPEGFAGDRSLLFRWHYLVGASRIVADNRLHGVGPDGFQAAYVGVRLPRSPEEVTSAHSVFADWLAMLGVFGAAWIGLAGTCLCRAGAALVAPPDDDAPPPEISPRAPLAFAAVVAALAMLPALAVEYHRLDDLLAEALRLAGVLGFVVAAAGLGALLAARSPGLANRALAAGAMTLLVHGQIEMTFFDPGSCVWVLAVIGLAGVAPDDASPRRWPGAAAAVACVLAAVWLGTIVPSVLAAQRWLHAAAAAIADAPQTRRGALDARLEAADLLEAAWGRLPADTGLLLDAARQRLAAAAVGETTIGPLQLDQAVGLADRAVVLTGHPRALALAADAWHQRAEHTGSPGDWQGAIDRARRLTELDPHGIGGLVRLGDLLWDAGRRDAAAEAYRRALAASADFELDPLKQLGEAERTRLEARSR